MSPYDEGRNAGRLQFAQSINPNPQCSIAAIDWYRGWFREMSVHRRNAPKPAAAERSARRRARKVSA